MTQSQRTQLYELLRDRGFKQGKFTLASGRESDFYIDVRSVALTAEGHWLLGRLMFEETLNMKNVRAVAGVELGGCSLASAVSLMSMFENQLAAHITKAKPLEPLPALYVRKKAKDHGTKKLVEAPYGVDKGAKTVLLEDVITTGGSSIRAAQSLKEAGYDVVGIIVVVDREEGGREAIEDTLKIPVKSILTRCDFV